MFAVIIVIVIITGFAAYQVQAHSVRQRQCAARQRVIRQRHVQHVTVVVRQVRVTRRR